MIWIWIGFVSFVLTLLALDLGVFNRKAHVVTVKEALGWSAVWITLGLLFSVFIYLGYENHWMGLGTHGDQDGPLDGSAAVVKYVTGYVIEKSLSVDNIFVIAIIFGTMAVPAIYQHRVLFWGIIGALVMRGGMIGIGNALITQFHWVLYVFAGFLILTALKMLTMKETHGDPTDNFLVRFTRRILPVTEKFHGAHFFVRAGSAASHEAKVPEKIAALDPRTDATAEERDEVVERAKVGTLLMTPLFLALIVVEFTDLVFAVDSIPAIYAITTDPFLVFTSNVFAILGLRSLYFALAGLIEKFRYLKTSLAVVLLVVGLKMIFAEWLKEVLGKQFNLYLLAVVLLILAAGVAASLLAAPQKEADHPLAN